jgi:uncharacterized protein YbjT (DUF2867 family)
MKPNHLPVVVFAASGVQGQAVGKALLAHGRRVRTVSASSSQPAFEHALAESSHANLDDQDNLAAALSGAAGAYLVIPVTAGERTSLWLENALAAAEREQLPGLIFELRGTFPDEPTEVAMLEGNRRLAERALQANIPVTVLRNSVYLENLLGPWVRQELVEEGVLRYPILPNQRIGWSTAQDSASVVVQLLGQPEIRREVIDLATADDPTGAELVSHLGHAIGRDVRLDSVDPAVFGQALGQAFGNEEVGRQIGQLYEFAQRRSLSLASRTADRIKELGVSTTSTASWAKNQSWR